VIYFQYIYLFIYRLFEKQYGSPPYGGPGYEKPSWANALCGFFLRHIFTVAGNVMCNFG